MAARSTDDMPGPVPTLRRLLLEALGAAPLPEDGVDLRQRQAWLTEWAERSRRIGRHREPFPSMGPSWSWYASILALNTLRIVDRWLEQEHAHTSLLVRLRPGVREFQRDADGEVKLKLDLGAEGLRTLYGCTARIDPFGPGGLLPSRRQSQARVLKIPVFQPGAFSEELSFEGGLRREQRQVLVRIELGSEAGERWSETWPLDAPLERRVSSSELPFPSGAPQMLRVALTRALRSPRGPRILVADPELGIRGLLEEATRGFGAEIINVDAAVGERLPAGTDPEELVTRTLDLLQGRSHERDLETPAGLGRTWRIAWPIERTLSRILNHEPDKVMGLVRQLFGALKGSAVVLVLSQRWSSRLGGAARNLERVLCQAAWMYAEREPAVKGEVADWIQACLGLGAEEARRVAEHFGHDLRLSARWVQAAQANPALGNLKGAMAFIDLPEGREVLRETTQSLEPLDVAWLIAGAMTTSRLRWDQLRAGHVAAVEYRTTPRSGSGKPVLGPGQAFVDEQIHKLRLDRHQPEHAMIEGYALDGGPTSTRAQLLSLLRSVAMAQDPISVFEALARRGLGTWREGVFRTVAPHRERLTRRYDETLKEMKRAGQRDTADREVFRLVAGAERDLSDCVPLEIWSQMPEDVLLLLAPRLNPAARSPLMQLVGLWTGGGDPARALRALYDEGVQAPPARTERAADAALIALGGPGATVLVVGPEHAHGVRNEYVLWLERGHELRLERVHQALDQCQRRQFEQILQASSERGDEDAQEGEAVFPVGQVIIPRVVALGPGAEGCLDDPERRVAILRAADLRWAAREEDWLRGVRQRVKAKLRLTAFSPFKSAGPLPPGSPLFKGRTRELDFIQTHIRDRSFLIVGGRRIGKTSVLHKIRHWALTQPGLAPLWLDCAGVGSERAFGEALARAVSDDAPHEHGLETVRRLVDREKARGRLAVFFLNEIDRLVEECMPFLVQLRGLHEAGDARFVMVGYAGTVATLNDPRSVFFNFIEAPVEAPDADRLAIYLSAFETRAAVELMGLLEEGELGLGWDEPETRRRGHRALMALSYRIPWLLQSLCQALVERLESQRSTVINAEDVRAVVEANQGAVWNYIDRLVDSALGRGQEKKEIQKIGIRLLLYALARDRYFLGEHPPIQAQERLGDPSEYGFSVTEAREVVERTLAQLLFTGEIDKVRQWFSELDLEDLFRTLALTLILRPDPSRAGRYTFLLHILPLELWRRYGKLEPTLDRQVVEVSVQFWKLLEREFSGRSG